MSRADLADSYADFETRVAAASPTSSKQDRVRAYVLDQAPPHFRRRDMERALPAAIAAAMSDPLTDDRDGAVGDVVDGGYDAKLPACDCRRDDRVTVGELAGLGDRVRGDAASQVALVSG
jgi:hypothetical protein